MEIVILSILAWLLIGWMWGSYVTNSRRMLKYIENQYWNSMHNERLRQYGQWVLAHPGIKGSYYHENKWKELAHDLFWSSEALERYKGYIHYISRIILLHSVFCGPIAIWIDLRDIWRYQRNLKLNKTTGS